MTPYMPQAEIAVMDFLIHTLRPKRVLEYGVGGSTVRWSGRRYIDEWTAVEHNREWFRKVGLIAGKHARLVTGSATDADAYVNAPGISGWYDLIFVDGLWRVECIQAAVARLQPWGVVVLHDASRAEYAKAWDVFPCGVVLTRGTPEANGLAAFWGDAWDR